MNTDQAIAYTYRKTGYSDVLTLEEYTALVQRPASDAAMNALKKLQTAIIQDVKELEAC